MQLSLLTVIQKVVKKSHQSKVYRGLIGLDSISIQKVKPCLVKKPVALGAEVPEHRNGPKRRLEGQNDWNKALLYTGTWTGRMEM